MSESKPKKQITVAQAYVLLRARVVEKLKMAAVEPGFAERYMALDEVSLKKGLGLPITSSILADLNTSRPRGWDLYYAMAIGVELGMDEIMPERELFQRFSEKVVQEGKGLNDVMVDADF